MRIGLRLAAAAAVAVCVLPAAELAAVPAAHASARAAGPAGVVAAAGELVNVATSSRMWSRQRNTELPMASITKVMTALVVLSRGDLNRKITVTAAAVRYAQDNSADSAGLHAGDVLTARQLLAGMLLPSGADAAYLLARSYGPGWRAFVREMNTTARGLGMSRTHFANFDGLPWPTAYSNYSTPRDLIIMGKAAMQNRVIRTIVGQRSHRVGATSQHHRYYWKNTNLLLSRYRGAIGIKTGFTLAAGYCLLFEAHRHGKTLMGVVLHSTNTNTTTRFTAAARLLNWGFARLK
jgi:serine-type D-Ala-D-Ala carboxypeptidase (penicillin-binding protein 5/6)